MENNKAWVRRALHAAGVAALATTAMVFLAAGPASAATGTVHTNSGESLTIRSGPHTSSAAVGSVPNGNSITFSCQAHGDTVTGKYGTSDLWDKMSSGYVSDTYVYTGSDGAVAPICGSGDSCTNGFGNPNTCAQAVTWAKNHETTTYHSDYVNRCDHVMALAYGFPASGSETALAHWNAIPASHKYAGDRSVPAGGLAFFGGGDGHVMISIGGGNFVSTDIHGNGTFTVTTIAQIENGWGKPYLGWAQPWFQYNH